MLRNEPPKTQKPRKINVFPKNTPETHTTPKPKLEHVLPHFETQVPKSHNTPKHQIPSDGTQGPSETRTPAIHDHAVAGDLVPLGAKVSLRGL